MVSNPTIVLTVSGIGDFDDPKLVKVIARHDKFGNPSLTSAHVDALRSGETVEVTVNEIAASQWIKALRRAGCEVSTEGTPRSTFEVSRQIAQEAAAEPPSESKIECPYCHTVGSCTVKTVRRKKGVSGGKATAALLTAGVSILATGLSRKESAMEIHCRSCGVEFTA